MKRHPSTARAVCSGIAGLCATLMAVTAQSAFQQVEDFEALTPGGINGQNSWVDAGNLGQVGPDPERARNQVLMVSTEPGVLYRALGVPEGTSRMLFMRFRFGAHGAYSFGLSHAAAPADYAEFGPETGMAADTAGAANNDLRVANGSTVGAYDVLATLTPDTWYNTWIQVDNSTDTYRVWLNNVAGGNAGSGDLLDNAAAETLFGFRFSGAADLVNFFIKTAGGSVTPGSFYIDDLYVENTGVQNLDNPVDSNGDGIPDAVAIALGLDPYDPAGDTDKDGLTDVIEIGGDFANPLDVDADGVIDALEPGNIALDARIAGGLLLANGTRVTLSTATGQLLSQVSAAAVTNPPSGISFPFGAIRYITTSTLGGNVTVRMTFTTALPAGMILYKQDNAGLLTELSDNVWTLVDPASVDVTLTDGNVLTDLDAFANSFIEDPVAFGVANPVASSVNTSGGGGGCVIDRENTGKDPALPLLVLIMLIYRSARRLCRKPLTRPATIPTQ